MRVRADSNTMVPPNGVRSKRLPTISWESVVDDVESSPDRAGDPPLVPNAIAPIVTQPATPPLEQAAAASFSSVMTSSTDPMRFEPTIEPISFAPLTLDPLPDDEQPVVRLAPMNPFAANAPVAPSTDVPSTDVPSTELPQIVEATQIPTANPLDGFEVASSEPQIGNGPRLPQGQLSARPPAAAYEMPVEYAPIGPVHRRRGSRRGLKGLLTLTILVGLVAAGIVFGRPYLFPDGWDEATQPYAEAVETARVVEYIAPIAVIAEPTADYVTRLGGELVGDWSADESLLRALGLLNGSTTEESVTELLAEWQDAVYSIADGQVYTDAGVTGAQLDAEITEEMAAASLDQEFRWSAEQPSRTLDDQAQTLAEVQRQASAVLAKTPFAVTRDPLAPGVLAFAPAIIGYRALAPAIFAEFENPATDAGNPLSQLGTGGPGPLASEVPVDAAAPTLIGTDTLVGTPRSLDRSFWFLVLAGFLDSRSAYQASESVVENSLATADRAGTQCAYVTFSGGDVVQTAALRVALEAWVAAAPIEFASDFSVHADGTLQLVSCDPGAGLEIPNRLGAARELVAWRTAELATLEAVRTADGTDAAAAWAVVEASSVGADLGALPGNMAPDEFATAARAAVAAVLTPAG